MGSSRQHATLQVALKQKTGLILVDSSSYYRDRCFLFRHRSDIVMFQAAGTIPDTMEELISCVRNGARLPPTFFNSHMGGQARMMLLVT